MILKNHLSPRSSFSNCTTLSLTLSCVALASTPDSSFTASSPATTFLSSHFVGPDASNDVSKRVVGLNLPKVLRVICCQNVTKCNLRSLTRADASQRSFRAVMVCGGGGTLRGFEGLSCFTLQQITNVEY